GPQSHPTQPVPPRHRRVTGPPRLLPPRPSRARTTSPRRTMPEAFILDGLRTPLGRYGGVLADQRPDDLVATTLRTVVDRTGIDPGDIDEVILGSANQAGEDNRNVARMAVLLAGLPESVPGFTVNRLCASGMTAITT